MKSLVCLNLLAIAIGVGTASCGAKTGSRSSGASDARGIKSIGDDLYAVDCKDGTTAIHTFAGVNSNQMCLVRAVVTKNSSLQALAASAGGGNCDLSKGTLLVLDSVPKLYGLDKIEIKFADSFSLSGCNLRGGFLQVSSLRLVSVPKGMGNPSYPSYPGF
jgi:hypothetical protein